MDASRDPSAAGRELATAIGLAVRPDGELELDGTLLRPLAVGWATVELDRAAETWPDHGPFIEAPPDRLLGATARLGAVRPPGRLPTGPTVVLLEPSTEGRLAAGLARRGEGWAVLYATVVALSPSGPGEAGEIVERLERAGLAVRRGSGPFGAALLITDRGSPSGGHPADAARPLLILVVDDVDGVPSGP